jgi:hypothetical protein
MEPRHLADDNSTVHKIIYPSISSVFTSNAKYRNAALHCSWDNVSAPFNFVKLIRGCNKQVCLLWHTSTLAYPSQIGHKPVKMFRSSRHYPTIKPYLKCWPEANTSYFSYFVKSVRIRAGQRKL